MTKGSVPEAPDGGHNSQAGTLLDAVPVALAVPPPAEELVVAVPAFEPPGVAPLMVGIVG